MTFERSATANNGRTLGIVGVVLSAIGFLILGIVLGPAGAVCGYLATRRGERTLGWIAVALGVVAFVLSVTVLALFADTMKDF